MKYISSELRSFCLGDGALPCWNTAEADLVVCSFFFWNIGSPLQKNYVGFLRAILYQICEQREDLIPAIMGQAATLEARNIKASESIQLCTWTEERLNTALIRFLASKPSSLRICLLIDGLDEFLGDEDSLMEMIRRLSRTPHTHVCVSSRPEQIFRQGFAKSPQLKLQDLNYKDIQKATNDQLKPTLEKWFPALTFEISGLVEDVIDKSQGVFLWAELMIKDLRRGACNADTIQELQERLNRTPDTIEGLYEHMLKRLDKIYAQDAARYFRLLMADQEILNGKFPLTLLHFACAEDRAWEHVLKRDQEHFQSSYFYNLCGNLETRILTRCVGFVEIEEHRPKLLKGAEILECLDNRKHLRSPRVYVSEEEGNISHYLREVRFIHRTVVEFLQNYKEFFQDPHGPQSACFALTRSRIGVLSLTPFVVPDGNVNQGAIRFNIRYLSHIINGLLATEASWSAQEATCDQAIHIINEMYNVITYVNMTVNEPMYVLSKCYEQDGWIFRMPSIKRLDLPFDDCVGFASFFGCHRYVSRYITQSHPGRPNFERIVSSVLMGMICLDSRRINLICSYNNIQRFKILLDSVPHSRDPCFEVAGSDSTAPVFRKFRSLVVFIYLSGDFIAEILARTDKFNARTLWMDVFAAFFNQTPDPNMILRFEYYGGQFVVGNRTLWIRYIMDESLLTYSMRKVASTEPNLSNEIGDLLRSRGGLEYRSFHSIGIEWFGQAGYLYRRLTLEQSERLRHTYTQAFSFQESGVDYLFDGDVCIPDEEPWPTTPDAEAEKAVNLLIEHMACENCDRHRVIDEDSVPDVNPDTDEDSISDAEAMELTDIFI